MPEVKRRKYAKELKAGAVRLMWPSQRTIAAVVSYVAPAASIRVPLGPARLH